MENLDKIINSQDEYIKLLSDELNDLAVFAHTHGWKSSRYEKGKVLREKIEISKQKAWEDVQKNKQIDTSADKQYLNLLKLILETGVEKKDRTGTGTKSIFSHDMRFDMREGFPLLTSKKMFMKGIIHELIWFLKGDTNIRYLINNDVHIWDGDCYKRYLESHSFSSVPYDYKNNDVDQGPWNKEEFVEKIKSDNDFANKWGNLGPIYGKQWRKWDKIEKRSIYGSGLVAPQETYSISHIDQIKNLISDLRSNPDSRRLMVSAWNPSDLNSMVLPPCHYGFQCWTREMTFDERLHWSLKKGIPQFELTTKKLDSLRVPKRYISLKWNQRSVDFFLGAPFNIASYGLLLSLLAKEVNMEPLDLIFSGGDCHLYLNHIDQAKEQLTRETYDLCQLKLHNKSLDDLKFEDIEIINYKSSPTLKAELSN